MKFLCLYLSICLCVCKSILQIYLHYALLIKINLKCMIQISHKINRLAFGDYFPGVVNPLDGYVFSSFLSFRNLVTHVFYWKFVFFHVWWLWHCIHRYMFILRCLFWLLVCIGHKKPPVECISILSRSVTWGTASVITFFLYHQISVWNYAYLMPLIYLFISSVLLPEQERRSIFYYLIFVEHGLTSLDPVFSGQWDRLYSSNSGLWVSWFTKI